MWRHPSSSATGIVRGDAARLGMIAGVLYGIGSRYAAEMQLFGAAFVVMSFAFLILVPIVLGVLTVSAVSAPSWLYRIFAPWVPALLVVILAAVIGWEGAICAYLGLPMILFFASVGGVFGAWTPARRPSVWGSILVLPLLGGSIERYLAVPLRISETVMTVRIEAPPATVWPLVASVDSIRPAEQEPALFTRLGFPRPVSATISGSGIGAVRRARFERGLVFTETVTEWDPGRRLSFTIRPNTDSIPPTTLDRHVTIGGPFFDVLTGTYELSSLDSGRATYLVLRSRYRVSTRFNVYAGWWANRIMASIQRNILAVHKRRAEARAAAVADARLVQPRGIIGGLSISGTLALLALAKSQPAGPAGSAATHTLAAYLLRDDVALSATFFAVGSTLFSYLLLRGRMILGVVSHQRRQSASHRHRASWRISIKRNGAMKARRRSGKYTRCDRARAALLATTILLLGACTDSGRTIPGVAAIPDINTFPPVANDAAPGASARATATAAAIGRGVNFGNMLEAPTEGSWGLSVTDDFIDKAAAAGFNSVRLPVRWSNHASVDAPFTIDPAFMSRVGSIVDKLLAKNLVVVLNMHHYRQLDGDRVDVGEAAVADAAVDVRFVMLWEQIATQFRGRGERLVFELYNEPHGRLNGEPWNVLAARALGVVRKTNPDRIVVIGPTSWNSATALQQLKIPNDANLIATVHNYAPFNFTHQGAEWNTPVLPVGVTCCNVSQVAEMTAPLETARVWSVAKRYPVFVGEFGAYSKADEPSRIDFNRKMRDAMEARGMSWTYWEFAAGFGVYDPTKLAFRQGLSDSLLGR